jgi:hypothetical protein
MSARLIDPSRRKNGSGCALSWSLGLNTPVAQLGRIEAVSTLVQGWLLRAGALGGPPRRWSQGVRLDL